MGRPKLVLGWENELFELPQMLLALKIVKFEPIWVAKPAPHYAIGCFEMLRSFDRVLLKIKPVLKG